MHPHLLALAESLNDEYRAELGRVVTAWTKYNGASFVRVRRGMSPSDVTVTVTFEQRETPVYLIEVFTETAWAGHGDPFMVAEHGDIEEAMRFIWQYVPVAPRVVSPKTRPAAVQS